MASPQSTALKQWTQILKRWPVDKLRPASVSFQHLMQQRLQRSTDQYTAPSPDKTKESRQLERRTWDEARELRQAHVLEALLADRFVKAYPTPQSLRNPASNPTHYDDVVKEMEEAPTRSWFSGLMKRVKGSLRLS